MPRKKKPIPEFCDCGESCQRDGSCDRCRFLDGANTGEADVIAALRLMGKASPCELNELCVLSPFSVNRILRRLRETGRVRRLGSEVYVFESNRHAGISRTQSRTYYELRST
jgi:hypothetical protein